MRLLWLQNLPYSDEIVIKWNGVIIDNAAILPT